MTTRSIEKMIDKESVALTKGQLFWHFSIIGLFLIPPIMNIINLFQYYVTHTYGGVRTVGEMAKWSYLPLIPALVFYFIQKRRLKFKEISVVVSSKAFIKAAEESAKILDWEIIEQDSNLFVAKSNYSWRSWGELITIIRDKERILFNSICDPDSITSVASWGKNKMNFETFEKQIKKQCALH